MLGQGVPAFANLCHPECRGMGETSLKVTEVWLSHLSEELWRGVTVLPSMHKSLAFLGALCDPAGRQSPMSLLG